MEIMYKVGITDYLVSGLSGGQRESGSKRERAERKIRRCKEEKESRPWREKKIEQKGLSKLKF
jgi:hypothetical protein